MFVLYSQLRVPSKSNRTLQFELTWLYLNIWRAYLMRLGFNLLLHTTFVTDEHLPIIERLRFNGYQGVEVPVMQGDQQHYARLGQAISSLGLECTCLTALPGPEANPISLDTQSQLAGREYLLRCVDNVAALGGKLLCGPTYQALGEFSGVGPTRTELERARDVHQALADHAADAGVAIAVEPLNRFECYLLNTLDDAAAHIQEVDRPNLGLLFDTFHANIEEKSLVDSLTRHVNVVRHVHLSENDRGIPGTGHINFPAVIAILQKVSYEGWVVVESFSRSLPALASATRIWRDLFDSPDEVVERAATYFLPLLK